MVKSQSLVNYAVNIGWNSNKWRGLPRQGEGDNFDFVARGGIPGESWNFDFTNRRNTRTLVYAYAPRIERARQDAGNIFLVAQAPEGRRFVVGLYANASILRRNERPWRWKARPSRSGRDAYINLAVRRKSAASCADPRLLSWNPTRYYRKPYGNRQWPGRQTFLILPEIGVRRMLFDLLAAHERWVRRNPRERGFARQMVALAQACLGTASRPPMPHSPPRSGAVPTAEVVKAERRKVEAERLLRNAPQLRRLKDEYGYLCQVNAQHRLDLPEPPPYIEVHHLQPVADGGVLADPAFSNCVVVCPSCHVLLQSGGPWIDPADGRTVHHFAGDRDYEGRKLKLLRGHRLSKVILRRLVPPAKT